MYYSPLFMSFYQTQKDLTNGQKPIYLKLFLFDIKIQTDRLDEMLNIFIKPIDP